LSRWLKPCLSIALILLPLAAVAATTETKPAIVLQLPPGMTAADVQQLVDGLQAKGAIMIRCKFTARPIRPTFLRRQALRDLIQHFNAAGIAFAMPPANASNPL
jgi:hypothetical protein